MALYWGVAQAAHLQNVVIRMPPSVNGNGHSGIRMGRGSTLAVADVRIEGGQVRSSLSPDFRALERFHYHL